MLNQPARYYLRDLGGILAVAALYFLFGRLSFSVVVSHNIVTFVVFIPEGIALAATIIGGRRYWMGVFIGQFFLVFGRIPLPVVLSISISNSLEAVIGAILFERLRIDRGLERLRDVLRFLMLVMFVLQPFSATLATLALMAGGQIAPGAYATAWISWWLANLLGQSIVSSFCLTWSQRFKRGLSRNEIIQDAALLIVLTQASLLAFGLTAGDGLTNYTLAFAIFFPLIVLVSIRYGPAGASLGAMVISAIALVATSQGIGPLLKLTQNPLVNLNIFLMGAVFTALWVAALFSERKHSEAELRALTGRLEDQLIAIQRLQEDLREQAIRDPLTGLFNRRYLVETLAREIQRCQRQGLPLSVIMADIDRFKLFNDTFGHGAGDALLGALGTFLQNRVRGEDVACRYGGEEFILILPGSSLEVAVKRANEICREVRGLSQAGGETYPVTVTLSLGVAACPRHGTSSEILLKVADNALYRAKSDGRDQVIAAE